MTRADRQPSEKMPESLRIVIRADGKLMFGALTDEMLGLAVALAPHDARLKARAARSAKCSKSRRGG